MKKLVMIFAVVGLISMAGSASANTIASSTMWFQGNLTNTGGVYTGTIAMTQGYYYVAGGAGESISTGGGFDVYAKNGGEAYVQGYYGTGSWNGPGGTDTYIVSDHDAYPSQMQGAPAPWGSWYNPDVADWDKYQLTLTANHWYLEYKGTDLGTPMSGAINWSSLLASEDDTGSYRGTVPGGSYANSGLAATKGGGAQAWDMDWTWGSEVIPLQSRDFAMNIVADGSGAYTVSLTPVPEPATMFLLGTGLLGLVGLVRKKKRDQTV